MSEHKQFEGCTENEEESEIYIVSPGETVNETNEHFVFEEETLQITDVHAFDHTDGEFQVHGTADLSSTSRHWSSNESSTSATRFLDQTPGIDTIQHGAIDLQSELAALGLNSLYPSAGQDVDSNFEISIEKSTSPKSHNGNTKETRENNVTVHSSSNTYKSIDILDEDSKVSCNKLDDIPIDRNKALFNDMSSRVENLNPLNVKTHKDYTFVENSTEINQPNNSCLPVIMQHVHQITNNVEIPDNIQTMSDGGNFGNNISIQPNISVQPSQSISDDESLEGVYKVCLSTTNISQDNFDGNLKENISHVLNTSSEKCSEFVADMSDFVQNISVNSDLLTEETDDVFVDAVDSFVSNKSLLYSEGKNIISSDISQKEEEEQNLVNRPDEIKETKGMERLEKTFEETYQVQLLGTDVEETCSMKESMSENVVVMETYQVHQSSWKIVEEIDAIEKPMFKDNIAKEPHMQQSSSMEDNIVEKSHAMKESVSQNNVVKENSPQKGVKEIIEMEECESNVIKESYQVLKPSSEVGNKESLAKEESNSENDVIIQTHQAHKTNSDEIVEEIHGMEEYMSKNDVVKRTHQLQRFTSVALVDETNVTDESAPDYVEETHQEHQSTSTEVVEETHAMEASLSENDVSESHQVQQSGLKEALEEIHTMENPMSKNIVVKETQHMQQSSSMEDNIVEKSHAMKESVSQNNVVKENSPQKGVKEIIEMEECESNVIKETYQVLKPSSEVGNKESLAKEESNSENDVIIQTHQAHKTNSDEIVEEIHGMEEYMSKNDVVKRTHQLQRFTSVALVDETSVTDESAPDYAEETHQEQQSTSTEVVEETHAMQASLSENDVSESHQVQQSSLKEALEEIHTMENPMSKNIVVKETQHMQQSSSEEATVTEETHAMEGSKFENNFVIGTMEVKQSRPEEDKEEKHALEVFILDNNVEKESRSEVVEEQHAMEEYMSENDVVEQMYAMEESIYENDIVKETSSQIIKIKEFVPRNNVIKETYQVQHSISDEIKEEAHAVLESKSENDVIEQGHQAQETSSDEVVEVKYAMEESTLEDNIVKETNSEEIVEEIYAMKEYMSENYVKETHKVLLTISEEIAEEIHATDESMPLVDVREKHQLQQVQPADSEEVVEETHATDESMSLADVRETHQVQQSTSEEVLQETHAIEAPLFENGVSETHQVQQSTLEEYLEETHSIKETVSKNIVVEDTYHMQQSTSEKVTEETHAMEGSMIENSFVTETKEQFRSEEVEEGKHAMGEFILEGNGVKETISEEIVEEILAMEEYVLEIDVSKETHKMQKSNPEDVEEEKYGMEGYKFEVNFVTETHQETQFSSVEVAEKKLAMEESEFESNFVSETHQVQQPSSEEVVEETHASEDSLSENEVMETHQLQQSSSEEVEEKTLVMGESLSKDNVVNETHKIEQSSSEKFVEEIHGIQDYMLESSVVKEILQMNHSGPEKNLDKLPVSEEYTQEDKMEWSGFEEPLYKTLNQINTSKEDVSEPNPSETEEQANIKTDFGSESPLRSFYSQRTVDMSLTIVGDSEKYLDTSKLSSGSQEERCKTPINLLSQTLTDLLDNPDIEETNDFTAYSDQKMYDALYMPLSGCSDNNCSVTESGVQSFMEITMANTNVAMIEQNLNNTTKQTGLNQDQRTSNRKESTENNKCIESPVFSTEHEELISCSNDYSSNFQSDLDLINKKKHELMQQSMSDYVTNLSLNLAIPDSCHFSNAICADEETRKKCEEQIESVLLMKWPAQYHNDIKILKQQNHLLSESINQKDTIINKLKLDNEDLFQKLSEVTAQSQDLSQENCTLKNLLNKSNENKDLLIKLQQENTKLSKDLEVLKNIESEFSNFKIKNKEFIHAIESNRLAQESEITVLNDKIEELEHELLNIGRTVIDFQSNSQEVSVLVESIHSKENEIETLIKDKSLLEEKVSYLSAHLETLDELKKENDRLKDVLQSEKEKSKDVEKLNIVLEKKINDMCDQNEKLSKLVIDLNEKEQQIQYLFKDKLMLEETVVSLNNHLEELRQIEDENRQLKYDLQEEEVKRQEILVLNKSLEEHISLQVENIAKLNSEICDKVCQIEALTNSIADLKNIIETLNQRLDELKEFEKENEQLKFTIKQSNEKIKEIKSQKTSLEEQVSNLNAQNELLWNELKVSSTKEQNLYALKEERLLLEEKLSQMKREIQEISNLKSDNEHLVDELTNKDYEIRILTADKKKLKSSLIKANDKLNERDAEIEKLSEELKNSFDKITKQGEILKEESNYERLILSENISNISEYLSSVIFENAYLAEQIIVYETEDKKLSGELLTLKKKILEEKVLFGSLLSEKESLVKTVHSLMESVTVLTEELNKYKYQCSEITLLREENEILTLKINNLSESVIAYEDEKTCILGDMSSLSETISNLLIDRQLLSEQLKISSDMSERLALLTDEKYQLEQRIVHLEQNNLVLHQSISTLQNQLETVEDKDKIIDELKDFSSDLEIYLSSMNEELMSEISKNQLFSVTINELESKFSQNNEEISVLQKRISSLTDQLSILRENDKDLQELVTDLENHISSLNEEFMSEIAKNHFITLENENLECQKNEIVEEKLLLESMVSNAVESIKNRLQNTDCVNNRQVSLQTYISQILLEINNLENKNLKLNQIFNSFQETLQNNNQRITDLLNAKQNLETELSTNIEQKLELVNKLTMALAKESDIKSLEKENEILLKVAETHKSCEDDKSLLQNEKCNLELQIQTLNEVIEKLRSEQYQFDTQLKENLQLKEVMTKEIYSLTGEIFDSKVEPLIEVYQRLMKEFLNKEKEVIFSLQSDCECKLKNSQDNIVSLKDELNKKDLLTSQLVCEVKECKMHLNQRDTRISCLENELITAKNEISNRSCEIEEIKLQAEKEKETLIAELNSVQHVKNKLEEKISTLSNEVTCKNDEISQLKNDLEKMQCEKNNILRHTEEDYGVSKRQKDLIDELTSKLNDKQELISQLNLQLQNKNNEVSQLTKFLEKKEIETRQYLRRIEEMTPAILKLNAIENEFELIKNVTSLNEEFDIESFVGFLQTCQVFGDRMKLVISKFVESFKQLQISNDNLKLELSNQVEVCKSLETQINDMNEELKSCKLLYDEDSLQFKEKIAAKDFAIANLTEALEQLKHNACLDADLKTECTEMESMKEELNKLKEENRKLQNESLKITFLTEVNRNLSWEIEELSRSIKFEKQCNIDLKAKCSLATSQVADLSKKNFQLEDKIDVLERKLENHDVMSSLKIEFPLGISTLDEQVQYLNEKIAEFDQINAKLNNLSDEHSSLKHEFEKSKEYIKKQEEKLCKIMKRELELKKQIATNLQTSPDIKILKELKTELLSLFPGESLSLAEALLKIKSLVKEEKKFLVVNNTEIENLKQKIEELSQENKDLDLECEMMNKHIKEQEELLASVFKREEELKKLNEELKPQLPNHLQINVEPSAVDNNLKELFEIFSEKPVSLKDCISLVKLIVNENQTLKEKISESQEEYASLDKECEDMFKAYKEKEKDLADVLKREASSVSVLKNKQQELENELKALSEELQVARSQITEQENPICVSAPCQCEELKSRLSEIKVNLAERNAKITALEMQFEADNFPLKKKVADLEKSLDQAKQKINELKSEVRRYQEQMSDVTVGLRAECEQCRSLGTSADPTSLTTLQQQLQEKNSEIQILKSLCKARKQKIKELEERDSSYKMPRSQRSALKEVKENRTVPPSPTKPSKGSLQ